MDDDESMNMDDEDSLSSAVKKRVKLETPKPRGKPGRKSSKGNTHDEDEDVVVDRPAGLEDESANDGAPEHHSNGHHNHHNHHNGVTDTEDGEVVDDSMADESNAMDRY